MEEHFMSPRTSQQRRSELSHCSGELLAISRAGHDKDVLYVVLREEGPYYWLADGKRRTLDHPKKKKKMHVQVIRHLPPETVEQMSRIENDAVLRKIIKTYERQRGAAHEPSEKM